MWAISILGNSMSNKKSKAKQSPKEDEVSLDSSDLKEPTGPQKLPIHIAVYSGGMDSNAIDFLRWCRTPAKEKANCIIILETLGGKADVAYRISRALQKKYNEVHIAIPWLCKSAGTLLCIGAHKLIFGRSGELGPLDIQVPKKDELVGFSSGLTPLHALSTLRDESFACFEAYFLSILGKGGGQISTARAAQIATNLTVDMLGNIYSQIDPMQLGQTARDLQIAKEYGERLDSVAQNLREGALNHLLTSYPEHGFVIDGEEAAELFYRVSPMYDSLEVLVEQYLQKMSDGLFSGEGYFHIIYDGQEATSKDKEDADGEKSENANLGGDCGTEPKEQEATTESGDTV